MKTQHGWIMSAGVGCGARLVPGDIARVRAGRRVLCIECSTERPASYPTPPDTLVTLKADARCGLTDLKS